MSWLDPQQERYHERQRARADLDEQIARLEGRIDILEQESIDATEYSASPNYIVNSHPEWSTAAYENKSVTPSTAGDDNHECYNWYRQTSATTALSATTGTALKRNNSGGHSLWAANEGTDGDIPIWDEVNATFLLGGETVNWDIACPLLSDVIFPGQTFYLSFEASLASGAALPSGLQFYGGFWDNTAGQQKWIEGSAFTPTISVQGTGGSRTLAYKVLAETDSGEQILSTEVSVTTAPSSLSPSGRVRLQFDGAPGFIKFTVYRKDGSNFYRVGTIKNSIDLLFYDQVESGDTVVPETGYPSVTDDAPKAYALTQTFDPADTGSVQLHSLTIKIPNTYDRSATTNGNQWFRFGVDGLMGSGDARGIVIRRIMVSEGFGTWTRSPKDLDAQSSPTSTATSAPTPSNPTPVPPDRGEGGVQCVTLDTLIDVITDCDTMQVPIGQIQRGDFVECGAVARPVKRIIEGTAFKLLRITTSNGCVLTCTPSHKIIRSSRDRTGQASGKLAVGDKILTCIDRKFEQSEIESIEVIREQTEIRTLKLGSPHLYVANGIVSHNLKAEGEIIV